MSQNGAFNGAPPWRPAPISRRLREGVPDANPNQDEAEIAELRRTDGSGGPGSLAAAWAGMGWDPELMCWTDPESLNAMAAVIETYPVRTAAELALVRDRELEAS